MKLGLRKLLCAGLQKISHPVHFALNLMRQSKFMDMCNVLIVTQLYQHAVRGQAMVKAGDTGEYWAKLEYSLVTHALWQIQILDELIDASENDCEDLWLLYDSKAAAQKIVDYYEPEGGPEGGYTGNVISFKRERARKT